MALELLRRFERAAFFRVAESYDGHTQVLALFDRSDRLGDVIVSVGAIDDRSHRLRDRSKGPGG